MTREKATQTTARLRERERCAGLAESTARDLDERAGRYSDPVCSAVTIDQAAARTLRRLARRIRKGR